jgi:hypothetical protein
MPERFCARPRRSAPPGSHSSKAPSAPTIRNACARSAGSIFRVPVAAALDQQLFLAAAEQRKIALFALMPKGTTDVGEVELGKKCAIIVGSEGRGVSERLRDKTTADPDSHRRGGIAQRGAGRGHRAVCGAQAKDGRRYEPVSLFEPDPLASLQDDNQRPLAERMRPKTLEEFVGQQHILGPGKPLRMQIERDQLGSIILWGPPGVGKTTLARIIARLTHCDYIPFSAVLSGIKEIKAVMADAERNRRVGRRTLIFIDEIHRFNKAQQDAFLPYVERGDISLIGATTENPSFEVISALAFAHQGLHAEAAG